MAALNCSATIESQLESVAAQRLDDPWEVVVADNGSTDDTVAKLRQYEDRIPAFTVIDASARRGQGYAVNRAVDHSSGELLVFIDSDDELAPGYLQAMAAALDKSDVVGARVDCNRLNPEWLQHGAQGHQSSRLEVPFGFLPYAIGCSIGMRRRVFDEIGGWDEEIPQYGGDIDVCWRAQVSGASISFVPEAVVYYRHRQSLKAMWGQGRRAGEAGPLLYMRYREQGMKRRSWRANISFYGGPLKLLLLAGSRSELATAVYLIAFRVGLLRGMARYKVLY